MIVVPDTDKRTLSSVMGRAHLGVAVMAVTLVGVLLTAVSLFALRAYADDNLNLIARSMVYTVEAAVVFHDDTAATEALETISAPEQVAQATVRDSNGNVLAYWTRPPGGSLGVVIQRLSRLLLPSSVVLPIMHEGRKVGSVEVSGHAGSLLRFLLTGFIGAVLCLVATAITAIYFSRRLVDSITGPMSDLARVAHAVRIDRAFSQRLEPAAIAELSQLGQDFNALLDEFEGWQNTLQDENSSLTHQVNHDSLTGLAKRAVFEQRLKLAIEAAKLDNSQLAVLFLDCNRFKEINDNYGHAAGDTVLATIATRLRARVRGNDLVTRLGGDEFAILVAPVHSVMDAVRVADNILGAMHAPITLSDGNRLTVALSIGIAVFPSHANQPETLLARADAAMYQAKEQPLGARVIAETLTTCLTPR
jgi:diguanylate cyclase (GGDEF)-like protein